MPAPLKTFIIYSRHDAEFKDELLTHLDAFVRKNLLHRWVDSDLLPGEEWKKRIEQELDAAHLVLMLVSADALNSDFIQKKELKTALEKKQRGAARIVPILVRDCLWDLEDDLAALQMLPKDERGRIWAVEAWTSRSSAWASACRELLKLIQEIHVKLEEENAAAERAREQEQAAAAAREAAVRVEKIRHKKDEQAWEKLKKEVAAAASFEEKIDFVNLYIEEEDYQNHREEAENWLHELVAEQEAYEKFEARKRKAEAERLARAAAEQQRLADEAAKSRNGQVTRDLPDAPEMVFVEGGRFQMGSDEYENEKPIHTVALSSFRIGKYPVTFEEYDAYCQATGAKKPDGMGQGKGRHPVVNVSWEEAQEYCRWLSEKTGKTYRLPTEAEWEFAARGGTLSQGFLYAGGNDTDEVAWYDKNSGNKTHPVGGKKANELGLHDMSGNVWEWCSDWYGDYPSSAQTNPAGPASGSYRVIRGGGAWFDAVDCRPARRNGYTPTNRRGNLGFRLVSVPLQ